MRNKLYDELEKEGYTFIQYVDNGVVMPRVLSLTDSQDWVEVNPTIVINNHPGISKGMNCNNKTIELLNKVLSTINQKGYSDYYPDEVEGD